MRRARAIATIIPLLGLWLAAALAPACCVQQACCANGMCPLPGRPAEPASGQHGAHHPAENAKQQGDCSLQSRCGHARDLALLVQLPPALMPQEAPVLPPLEPSGMVSAGTYSSAAAPASEPFHPPRS